MTKSEIAGYLYFFWAPILKVNRLTGEELDRLRTLLISTMSQASVYIDAPDHSDGNAELDYSDEIQQEVIQLTDDILNQIPLRGTDKLLWLKITIQYYFFSPVLTDIHLQKDAGFGPFEIGGNKFISLDFYAVPYQLQLQLPTTTEVSAVLSFSSPPAVPDGVVTTISLETCTLWLCVNHFDRNAADTALYFGLRLSACSISFDSGYSKSGNRISPGQFDFFSGFSLSATPSTDFPPAVLSTIAAGNSIIYPGQLRFRFKHAPGQPPPPRISLEHIDPFDISVLGNHLTTDIAENLPASWQTQKNVLSFALTSLDTTISVQVDTSAVFSLKGDGAIDDLRWYLQPVSTNHPLKFSRLGLAPDCGSVGFGVKDTFSLSWEGMSGVRLQLQDFFLRASPIWFQFSYNYHANKLANHLFTLWNIRSSVGLTYGNDGNGNFISDAAVEQHSVSAVVDVNIDRPLLSSGERFFSKSNGQLILTREVTGITAVTLGTKMNPAVALENSAYRQLSSIAVSNALILTNPVEQFVLAGKLNEAGRAESGICIAAFPVPYVEHTLPDPYITNLFGERKDGDDNIPAIFSLRAEVSWNDSEGVFLNLTLGSPVNGISSNPATKSDNDLADDLLKVVLAHPGAGAYENLLADAINASPQHAGVIIQGDEQPYGTYQSPYLIKTNTTGAYSTLHLLPGNVALVDVSGRASQMGVSFSRTTDGQLPGVQSVLDNTGYNPRQLFRMVNNELVSSGRFVRAFTLPHVQWEPAYFRQDADGGATGYSLQFPFLGNGAPSRISSANKADISLSPVPVTDYIVKGFLDDNNHYAAAAHFGLPFGMNAVALFHPVVEGVSPPKPDLLKTRLQPGDPYSYSTLWLNQPEFILGKQKLVGAIQIRVASHGLPGINRDISQLPDPSFHGSLLQIPQSFAVDQSLGYNEDSILGKLVTHQLNIGMWGAYQRAAGDPVTMRFRRSAAAKVPLRRVDFSGYGAAVFSNWLNKFANAGTVSQAEFEIMIGRVAHEVIQISSVIIPWFIPVVRSIIIERKNHGKVIQQDTGWVATGPGEFRKDYDVHPGVIRGAYHVTSIKDTSVSLPVELMNQTAKMAGVYFDADIKIENVVSGFSNQGQPADGNYRMVPSKKQFGYIILGNPGDSTPLEVYFSKEKLKEFMSRSDVGALGGPLDCLVNIAGSDMLMHLSRVEVTVAAASPTLVAAVRGTLQFPKGGSWTIVKKLDNGSTVPLAANESVALIRNGLLGFDEQGNPAKINFNASRHVLGNPAAIEIYATTEHPLGALEYALLQSTDTQKMLFPRPSFECPDSAAIVDGIAVGRKNIFITDPKIADPYSLLKSNTLFPDAADVLSLKNDLRKDIPINVLDIQPEAYEIAFSKEITDALTGFVPPECTILNGRRLSIVNSGSFEIYLDYGATVDEWQKFTTLLGPDKGAESWKMGNTGVALVVNLDKFAPLLTIKGDFTATPGNKPSFNNATIIWNDSIEEIKKIIEVLTILYQLSQQSGADNPVANGFSFTMGNSPDSWSYKCNIEEKIPVIQFPNAQQLSLLPGPAPLIVQAGLDLGIFFNLSLSADPKNLIKPGAGITLGFEATIQVLLITIEVATAYGVGTAKVDMFLELPDANPSFKFTMGFGATVAVQLPVVGYVSLTRVISLGADLGDHMQITVGQLLKGVLTVAGGLASVGVQVEASGTVVKDSEGHWTGVVRAVFTLDVSVAFVFSWDFSEPFEHHIALPNPF